jgi:cell fate regulator YaaT (PSP1 superfamily)
MTDQTQALEPFVVGLRFQKVGKIYHFEAGKFRDIIPGDFVVVETSRGTQLGQVIQIVKSPEESIVETIKPVQRVATPQDLVLRQTWQQKEIEAVTNCRGKVTELGLTDVKIVAAEYSFDGSRLYFLFSSEAGEKADLRSLRRAMQRAYQPSRVEMHLVGPRDVAKILGGMGACGLENRCCSTFLTEFSPISIKMAKEQGISLTPTEITGMCGRLRCCLVYEYEQYVEARKQLPKRGKRVGTPMGEGKVVDVYPLKESVVVELDQGARREFMKHELQPLDELEAFRNKAEAGCEKHPDGNCDCGKKGKKKGRE